MPEERETTPPKAEAPPPAPAPATPSGSAAPPRDEARPEPWEVRFKYLLADFENYRKRAEREKENHRLQVRAQLLRELLPILEAFEHARSALGRLPANDPLRTGLDLLGREWEAFLKAEGVERVARVGGRFDPETHDAIAEAAASPGAPEGTVVEVVQQGYTFSGGLLRPAKVVVARASRAPAPAKGSETAAAATAPEGNGDAVE